MAALTRLGEKLKDTLRTPAEMLDSTDRRQRLAAVPIVREMPPSEGVPLLRRLVADLDPEVRHAGVDAIEGVVAKDRDQAIMLYKPLVGDADPVVRSKASGQLSRLVKPPDPLATRPVGDPPTEVKVAAGQATAAAAEAKLATEAFDALATDLVEAMAPARDGTGIKPVEDLATSLGEAAAKLEALAARVEAAAKAASDAAGANPLPNAAKLVNDAKALAQDTRGDATMVRGKMAVAADKVRTWVRGQTGDVPILIAAAEAAIAAGDLVGAKHNLDKAAELLKTSGAKNANLDYTSAQLYDQMADHTQDRAAKRKLLNQAKDAYQRFSNTGMGPRVQRSNDRVTEIVDETKALAPP
jgi:hypothetical protein